MRNGRAVAEAAEGRWLDEKIRSRQFAKTGLYDECTLSVSTLRCLLALFLSLALSFSSHPPPLSLSLTFCRYFSDIFSERFAARAEQITPAAQMKGKSVLPISFACSLSFALSTTAVSIWKSHKQQLTIIRRATYSVPPPPPCSLFDESARVLLKSVTLLRRIRTSNGQQWPPNIDVFVLFRLATQRFFSDDNNKFTRRVWHVRFVFVRNTNVETR